MDHLVHDAADLVHQPNDLVHIQSYLVHTSRYLVHRVPTDTPPAPVEAIAATGDRQCIGFNNNHCTTTVDHPSGRCRNCYMALKTSLGHQ